MSWDHIAERLSRLDGAAHGRGGSAAEIDACEKRLGVIFPDALRGYLARFGWMTFGPHELFGVGGGERHSHVAEVTEDERELMYPPIPHRLVPIYNNGAGDHACVVCDPPAADHGHVVWWWHEDGPDQEPQEEASSLDAWIEGLMDGVESDPP